MSLAIDFIKDAEGLRLKAYQDSAMIWTIGFGHTGPDVRAGLVISEPEAEDLLRSDMAWAVDEVRRSVKVALSVEQHAALVSLVFNIGTGGFRRSTVLRRVNAGDMQGAAEAILMWNKITVGGKKLVSKGLVNRRERERALFLSSIPEAAESVTGGEVTGGEAKPLIKSKTQWWAGLGLSGVLAKILAAFSGIKLAAPEIVITIGPFVLLGAIFVGIMFNRWMDSRKGVH